MRLSSVSVHKYRSIDETATFDVGDFTVLIGPNNQGKSNLLRATALAMQEIEGQTASLQRPYVEHRPPNKLLFQRIRPPAPFSRHRDAGKTSDTTGNAISPHSLKINQKGGAKLSYASLLTLPQRNKLCSSRRPAFRQIRSFHWKYP